MSLITKLALSGHDMEESHYLFKYRHFSFSGERDHRRMVLNNELFFPSPDNFNDPFDSNIPFRYEEFTYEEFRNYWAPRIAEKTPHLAKDELAQTIQRMYDTSNTPEGRQTILQDQEGMLQQMRSNTIGIYSLSASCRSILSWGHYSDSHRGFCVGLSKEKLISFVRSQESLDFDRVEYSTNYPVINVYKMTEAEKLTKLFWTKSIEWEYEKEYRIIWYNGASKTFRIDPEIIEIVIIGCQAEEGERDAFMAAIRSSYPSVSIFQATMRKDGYGLDFETLG